MRTRAFTLVEMLIVVAVIGILIGILLPALGGARSAARTTVCVSNMRTLGLAHELYRNANDGKLIDAGFAEGDGSLAFDPTTSWINTLRRFYREPIAAQCPNDNSPHLLPDDITPQDILEGDYGGATPVANNGGAPRFRVTSYAINGYFSTVEQGEQAVTHIDALRRPSGLVMFVESAETGEHAGADHVHPDRWSSVPIPEFSLSQAILEMELDQHGGANLRTVKQAIRTAGPAPSPELLRRAWEARANYAFLDGSVRTTEFQEVYTDVERNLFDPSLQ